MQLHVTRTQGKERYANILNIFYLELDRVTYGIIIWQHGQIQLTSRARIPQVALRRRTEDNALDMIR